MAAERGGEGGKVDAPLVIASFISALLQCSTWKQELGKSYWAAAVL